MRRLFDASLFGMYDSPLPEGNDMTKDKVAVVLVAQDRVDHELVSAVRRIGGYAQVEMGCLNSQTPSLPEVVGRVVSGGVGQVVLLPTLALANDDRLQVALVEQVEAQRALYPEVEFVTIPTQLEADDHARILIQNVAQVVEDTDGGVVPLSFLPPRQRGVVQQLSGGHEFVSRLAVLGFIPGAPLQVVQNFGVGPLIVSIRDTRIALGREEAHKVRVRSEEPGNHVRGRRHRKRGHFE